MDDALYSSLCRTMRAICLAVQTRPNTPAPLLVEWQRWAKAFVAGLYHRESAVRAALSARREAALLELDDPETSQFAHAAADLALAAVHAAAGEHEKAEPLAHAARERFAAQLGTAALARTLDGQPARESDGGNGSVAAAAHEHDAAAHARLLIQRDGPSAAADMTALRRDQGQRLLALGVHQDAAWDGALTNRPTTRAHSSGSGTLRRR